MENNDDTAGMSEWQEGEFLKQILHGIPGRDITGMSEWQRKEEWLQTRLYLAMRSAWNAAEGFRDEFLHDLNAEPDRAEEVFNKHRDYHLAERHTRIQYNHLYTDFYEKQGEVNQTMLQSLTRKVHALTLNMGEELTEAERLIEKVYAFNFAIKLLNQWKIDRDKATLPATPNSPFKLSIKKGVKANIIRVLNALYELRLIELENGTLPDKGLFIKQIGGFLGVNAEDYSQDLEQALSQSLEANVKVFDELKKKITEQVLAKENGSRK